MRIDSAETEGLPKSGGPMHVRVLESGNMSFRREYDDTNVLVTTPVTSLGARIFPYSGALRFENIAPHAVDQKIILESASYEITEGVWTPGHEPLTIQLVSPEYNVGDSV